MFVAKVILSLLIVFHLNPYIEAENVFSKPGKRYTYEYNVDLQVNPEVDDVKKIGYKIYFDVYPKNGREYVIDITDVKPYQGDNVITSPQLVELKAPFLVRRLKSRNVNKHSDYKISFTNSKESLWSQNLKKALVSLFEVDYRPTEVTYAVSQETLSGTCDYKYVVDRRPHRDIQGAFLSYVTRVKDDNIPCFREKTHSYFLSDKVAQCFQKTDLHSKRDYVYTIDEIAADHLVVKHVVASEKLNLVYGFHHEVSYPIVSKQVLTLLVDEIYAPEQSSNLVVKELFGDSKPGDYLQTTLEGHYQPYYGPDTIEDKYFVERINELAPKVKGVLEHKDIDLKKFLHYDDILFKLLRANYDELKRLYDLPYNGQVDQLVKAKIFFVMLSQVPNYDGVKFILEHAKEYIEGAPTPVLKEPYLSILIRVLHSAKFPLTGFTKEQGEHFLNYCKQDFVRNDRNLHKVCWLSFSRVINGQCVKTNPSCTPEKAEYFFEQTLQALNFKYQDQAQVHRLHNENLLLVIKVIKNFRLASGLPILRTLLLDKQLHHGVRKEAAYVFYAYDKFDETTLHTLLSVVNDRKEDFDLRLAIFLALIPVSPQALIPTVVRLRNSFVKHTYEDDQQLIHSVHDILYYSSMQNKTTCNERMNDGSNLLYKYIGDDYRKYFPQRDIANSLDFNQNWNIYRKVILTSYASTNNIIPESLFFSYGDSFNVQEFFAGKHHFQKFYSGHYADKPESSQFLVEFIKSLNIKKLEDLKINSYTLSYVLNQYEVFFVYSDEHSTASLTDISLFLGNPLKNLFFIEYGSLTEAGFPYYFHAKHSRYVDPSIDISKYSVYLPFASHGYIATTVFLPLTDHYLLKARSFSKYMKEHVQLEVKNMKLDKDEFELDSLFHYKQTDYHEIVHKYHFIEAYKSLPHYFFRDGPAYEFNGEKYLTEVDNQIEGYTYEIKAPFHHYESVDKYLDNLHFVWLPTDTLLHRDRLLPYLKQFRLNGPKTFGLKIWRKVDQDWHEYYFGLTDQQSVLYDASFKYMYDDLHQSKHYMVHLRNGVYSHNTLVKVDILYPQVVKVPHNVKQLLTELQNATFAAKIYYSPDLNKDIKSEDNIYTQVQGVFYKKSTPDRVYEYQTELDYCREIKSEKCHYDYLLSALNYDSLVLDIKQVKPLPETHELALKFLHQYYNYFYQKYATFDPYKKTELHHVKMHLSSLYMHPAKRVNSIQVTSPLGHLCVHDYPAFTIYYHVNLVPYIFPSSSYYLDKQFNRMYRRLFNFGYCLIKNNYVETFDELKLFNQDIKFQKPLIAVADYEHNDFVITLPNKYTFNVYYYQGVNLTVDGLSNYYYYDGKQVQLDITGEKAYNHKYFTITVSQHDGVPKINVFFENGLTVSYYNGFHIRVPPTYVGSLTGICGNYDRQWSNELINKLGDEVLPKSYVVGWQY